MADIAEQICQAVDTIVKERLRSINYDTTIKATIIDNTDAKKNKYICFDGSVQFEAFSANTDFQIDEVVLVTIPNNDYSQQKIIAGRYIGESTSTQFSFVSPFETIVDISGNLIKSDNSISASLLANEDYEKGNQLFERFLHGDSFVESLTKYTRFGIRGEFRSWLKSLKAITGDYGYRLELFCDNGALVTPNNTASNSLKHFLDLYISVLNDAEDINFTTAAIENAPAEWFTEKYGSNATFLNDFKKATKEEKINMAYIILHDNSQITEFRLTSNDMIGNPYDFQSYYIQEKVVDISTLPNIYGYALYFYEQSKTFLNSDNKDLPYSNKDEPGITAANVVSYPNNLFTQQPYLCIGYGVEQFQDDSASLYTLDGTTYVFKDTQEAELNKKTIRLRWVHKTENGLFQVINEDSFDKNKNNIYEIRWYRYRLGAPSADEYSGVYWDRIADNTNKFSYVLEPQQNHAVEQVKAIILYNGTVIRSDILVFTCDGGGRDETLANILGGLSLFCVDTWKDDKKEVAGKSLYGNYFLYGQNNNLIDESQAKQVRSIQARFAGKELLESVQQSDDEVPILTEASEITWEFPLNYTMITVDGFNYNYDKDVAPDANGNLYKMDGYFADAKIVVKGNSIFITRPGVLKNGAYTVTPIQDYRINKTYNSTSINNTIKCSIKKDTYVYSAEKELSFGPMGTNGTDVTVVIDFDNNKVALTADSSESLPMIAHIYDSQYNKIDLNNTDYSEVEIEWSWAYYNEDHKIDPDILNDLTEAEIAELESNGIKNSTIDSRKESILQNYYEAAELEQTDINALTPEDKLNIIHKEMKNYKLYPQYQRVRIELPANATGAERAKCNLVHKKVLPFDRNYFIILQVTIKNFGNYELIAYKAIPIRANKQYRYIVGPSEIIYDSTGSANYYKQPIELYKCEANKVNEYDFVEDVSSISRTDTDWDLYNPYTEDENFIGNVSNNNILIPATLYVQDVYPYGYRCFKNSENKTVEDTVWIQPLVIMQNRYASATLNKWDGKGINLDDKEGTIVAPAIAAGKKNSDNTFSGVMLGDWSKTNTAPELTKQTGIYGFHHGAVSFAFKEDGTGWLGKEGRGRIEFDGNTGVIKSANWKDLSQNGMFLDLDDGILKLQKEIEYKQVDLTKEEYETNKTKYYIVSKKYVKVPVGTKFGEKFVGEDRETYTCNSTTLYYRRSFTLLRDMTVEKFATFKYDNIYVRNLHFKQCQQSDGFDVSGNTTYYAITKYTPIGTISEASYNKYKNELTIIKMLSPGEGAPEQETHVEASSEAWEKETEYYRKTYEAVTIDNEEFDRRASKYYTVLPDTYDAVVSPETFETWLNYYESVYKVEEYSSKGPPENWNTVEDTKNNNYYYIYIEKYKQCTSSDAFIDREYYYTKEAKKQNRYITLSSQIEKYPLAIGTHKSESLRDFRVDWDGTAYINNGEFKGNITAEYLYCEKGYIGGWVIGNKTLSGGNTILHSQNGISTNKITIFTQVNSEGKINSLGAIGLVEGQTSDGNVTYNIGISSTNQSIVLDTMGVTGGSANNIAFISRGGTWAQCETFSVRGNTGSWNCPTNTAVFLSKQVLICGLDGSDDTTVNAKCPAKRIQIAGETLELLSYTTGGSLSDQLSPSGSTEPEEEVATIAEDETPSKSGTIIIDSGELIVRTPKDKQSGIYARFA